MAYVKAILKTMKVNKSKCETPQTYFVRRFADSAKYHWSKSEPNVFYRQQIIGSVNLQINLPSGIHSIHKARLTTLNTR